MNFNIGDVANAFKLKAADSIASGMQRVADKATKLRGQGRMRLPNPKSPPPAPRLRGWSIRCSSGARWPSSSGRSQPEPLKRPPPKARSTSPATWPPAWPKRLSKVPPLPVKKSCPKLQRPNPARRAKWLRVGPHHASPPVARAPGAQRRLIEPMLPVALRLAMHLAKRFEMRVKA